MTTLFESFKSQLFIITIKTFRPSSSREPTKGFRFQLHSSSRFTFFGLASKRTFSKTPWPGIVTRGTR